jgi:hypothetical protein
MTTLGITDAHVQDSTAWCQVVTRDGPLQVGDRVTQLRAPDGATAAVDLVVESIELVTGLVTQIPASSQARVRLTGAGADLVRPGIEATSAVAGLSDAAQPGLYPGQQPYPGQPGPQSSPGQQPYPGQPYPSQPYPGQPYPGQPYPGPYAPPPYPMSAAEAALLPEGAEVELTVEPARAQRRVTIAFRSILVIPHLIILYVLGIAAEVVAIIGWFAALFTGQLPSWAHSFLGNYLQWQIRAYAYLYFLTDVYPPFELGPAAYPVSVWLPRSGRLSRVKVFFRALLSIPVTLVAGMIGIGIALAGFVIWLVVLIAGRPPAALFGATSGWLRFGARATAYSLLLTDRYPRRLAGDRPDAASSSLGDGPTAGGAAMSFPSTAPVGTTAPTDGSASQTSQSAQSSRFAIVLSGGAKALLVIFAVLGLVGIAGYVTLIVVASSHSESNQQASNDLTTAHNRLDAAIAAEQENEAQCAGTPDAFDCARKDNERFADALDAFHHDVTAIDPPAGTSDDFDRLSQSVSVMASDLHGLADTSDPTVYTDKLQQENLQGLGTDIDTAYEALQFELENRF